MALPKTFVYNVQSRENLQKTQFIVDFHGKQMLSIGVIRWYLVA